MNRCLHFAVDSRKVKKGSLFFALKGKKTDGHAFLREAKALGAKAAVVSSNYKGPNFGLQLIYQQSVIQYLCQMSKEKIVNSGAKIVAITGSVGKTTTKEFLVQLLEKEGVVATRGNENTTSSIALTILNEKVKPIYVLEMGMSEPNDIEIKLSQIPSPLIAILTPISLSHVQNFTSFQELVEEKKKILRGVEHPLVHESNRLHVEKKVNFYANKSDEMFKQISLAAKHLPSFLLENAHAAVLAALRLGQEKELLIKKLAELKVVENRFSIHKIRGIDFINDAYNASYLSFSRGIDEALTFNNKRKIAVVAQMQELGDFSDSEHKKVAQKLAAFDWVFCLGRFCSHLNNSSCFDQLNDLVYALNAFIDKQDLVYIKGANSSGLYKLLAQIN